MIETTLTVADLRGQPRRLRKERLVRLAFLTAALVSVVISALIVLSLAREAWTFASEVDWGSVWQNRGWFPRRGLYDVGTLLAGSLIVTVIAMLVAGPIGMASAIYLAEYAGPRTRRILKPTLEVLAGIPSVVVGFFAVAFVSPEIIRRLSGEAPLFTLAAAGIGVGVLTIPLIASVGEDAMRSVPKALREASYGLGARRVTTTIRVVLPAAVSGIVAAFILAVSRAMGETMVVFLAAGAGGGSQRVLDPFESGTTMTAAMASLASGTDSVKGSGLTFQSLFFIGAVLFVITLLLNIVADRFVRRVRQKY
jgi:phosphate transport system permease protein